MTFGCANNSQDSGSGINGPASEKPKFHVIPFRNPLTSGLYLPIVLGLNSYSECLSCPFVPLVNWNTTFPQVQMLHRRASRAETAVSLLSLYNRQMPNVAAFSGLNLERGLGVDGVRLVGKQNKQNSESCSCHRLDEGTLRVELDRITKRLDTRRRSR